MSKIEELFNASQFVLMQCFGHAIDLHKNLQDININSARASLNFIREELVTLEKLVNAIEKAEYAEAVFDTEDNDNNMDDIDYDGDDEDEEETSTDSISDFTS